MKFRSEFIPSPVSVPLDPRRHLLLIGSCFSDAMGAKMKDALWPVTVNPCGVLYNPLSIRQTLEYALMPENERKNIIKDAVVTRDGVFLSWLTDSSIVGRSADEYVDKAMESFSELHEALTMSQALIITYGTSFVYRLENGSVVANCHKFPSSMFCRSMLSVDESIESLNSLAQMLRSKCPGLRVIQTLSPVRHLADGFHGNALSKAGLLLAADSISRSHSDWEYFPSYEILNDDLRDYRFYASDLCHPSSEAEDYIWEKFLQTYLDSDGMKRIREGEAITRRLRHRPLIPDTEADRTFREKTRLMLRRFRES